MDHLFHLAIPAYDLDAARAFYVDGLGCRLARRYDDRITLDFFGDQLVCHLSDPAGDPGVPTSLYPRHFGITVTERAAYDDLHRRVLDRALCVYAPRTDRFGGRPEAHETFVLMDPSHNLVEFKHYPDPAMRY